MDKITFLNKQNQEIIRFNNFIFSETETLPVIYNCLFTINLNDIKLEKKIDGIEDDFFILSKRLHQLLYENWNQFTIYLSTDDSFQIIFEIKESQCISVLVIISDAFYGGSIEFKYEYEIEEKQALSIIKQIDSFYKRRNGNRKNIN